MAGAIAGAYYGSSYVPDTWRSSGSGVLEGLFYSICRNVNFYLLVLKERRQQRTMQRQCTNDMRHLQKLSTINLLISFINHLFNFQNIHIFKN